MRTLVEAGEVDPRGLANTAWAFASLSVVDATLMSSIAAASRRRILEFGGQGISNMVWSIARLCVQDEPLIHAIADAALPRIIDFENQDISNTAWSFAVLG
mmetsp:Transcript_40491/g.64790  ORF Transcript_40491/g.64790 Transcript_40491/m.64790 type:complete len:101 (+) Transcript_40491:337-639(+)